MKEIYEKHLLTEKFNAWELDEFKKRAKNDRAWDKKGDSVGLTIKHMPKNTKRPREDGYLVIKLLTPSNLKGSGVEKRHGKYNASVVLSSGRTISLGDFDKFEKAKDELINYMINHIKENIATNLKEGYTDHLLSEKKAPIELGKSLYLHRVGYDANGNWSYWVSKGGNKAKKIQAINLKGGSNKIRKDAIKSGSVEGHEDVVKGIIDYYYKHMDK